MRRSDEFGLEASAPYSGTVYDLAAGAVVTEALPQPVKKAAPAQMGKPSPKPLFEKLMLAAKRLYDLMSRSEGRSNRDVERMTRRINDLCNEWEKE